MSHESQQSSALPPLEAWKQPDKWIDVNTGFPRTDVRKIVLEPDDRGIVFPVQAVQQINEVLFHDDYDWPYDPDNNETRVDNHHFHWERADYAPEKYAGSKVPLRFRESAPLIGRMPRQFHMAIHCFTEKPEVPDFETMRDYADAYATAISLYIVAQKLNQSSRLFSSRRKNITEGSVIPLEPTDQLGEEYMRTTFSKTFEEYSEAIDAYAQIASKDYFPAMPSRRLSVVRRELSKRAVARHRGVNLVPLIRGVNPAVV